MAKVENSELISVHWQKFLAKFQEIETLKNSQWKEVHLLAYFCKRFESHFGKKFALSYKGAPSKCQEIFLIKRTMAMLGTTNMRTIREYIDWVFDLKLIPKKLKIRTIGFLVNPAFVNEFNLYREEKTKIVKTTELPKEYKEIASIYNVEVSTYGDLAFIKMAVDQSPENESRAPYKMFLTNLLAIGFEPSVLNDLR